MLVMISLLIFSISDFPSVIPSGSQLGTTVQAKGKGHLPNLLDQQIAILVGLDINPNWVKEQSAADSLIYGIVKPDDTVPAGINEDYSYLVTSNRDKEISLFFKADKKKVTIKYANHGEKMHTKTVPLSRLVEQSYRIKKQRQQVNKYVSALRTE
ncbi:Lreu_0056 family protein [Limosilactobacillus reuteri]